MAGPSRVSVTRAKVSSKPLDTKPLTKIGAVAPTERGPIGSESLLSSLQDFERIYGQPTTSAPDAYLEIKALFDEAGDAGAEVHFSRVVHCTTASDPTTKTSAAATLNLSTASVSATSGSILAATGPYVLANGDTIVLKIDGGGNQTFTLAATAAVRTAGSTGPYVLSNGMTLNISIDGVALPAKVFATGEFVAIGAATAAEVVASLNAFFAANNAGAVADVNANAPRITSNRKGTGSHVQVTGGTANVPLNFNTADVAGTGDASNIAATTAAELVTKLAGLTGAVASAVSGALKVTSSTTGGSSSVQLDSSSTTTTKLGLDNAIHTGFAAGTQVTVRVDGKTDGAFANALSLQVLASSNGQADHFNLYVIKGGVVIERFANLNFTTSSANYLEKVVNLGSAGQTASNLIKVTNQSSTLPSPSNLPAVGTFGPMTGGNDGLAGLVDADYTGGVTNGRTGLRVLDTVQALAVAFLPGRATATASNALVTYCENTRQGQCFAIINTPASLSGDAMISFITTTALLKGLSELSAVYWPRIMVDNPNGDVFGDVTLTPTVACAPAGAIAGLYARMDQSKEGGAFEHPASIETGFLRSARALESTEVQDDAVRGRVFDSLINPINVQTGTQVYVDGARCLKDSGPFPTVGESRGILFLQLTIGAAFDPKRNQNLRPRFYNELKMKVDPFMRRLTRAECFATTKDSDAWFFDAGSAINTAADANARTANTRLGVATSKPGEFINVVISPLFVSAA